MRIRALPETIILLYCRFLMKTPSLFRRCSGFTLVEILAVIAIVGVLAAIIIPVTARVRAKMEQTECASNLRQIGMATQLYVSDNEGVLPGPLWSGQKSFFPDPPSGQLLKYLEPYLETSVVPTPGSNRTRATVFLCPSFPEDIDPVQARHYGVNQRVELNDGSIGRIFGRPRGNEDGSDIRPIRLNALKDPSSTWMVKDFDQAGIPGYQGSPYVPELPVHGDVRNHVFFDGHVEAVPVE